MENKNGERIVIHRIRFDQESVDFYKWVTMLYYYYVITTEIPFPHEEYGILVF